MTVLPNTTTKGAGRRWPLYALVAVALVALALCVEAFLRAEKFSPGKEILSPNVRSIAASAENSLYPPPDTNLFEERPETVFVYLSVEGLPSGDLEAHVERVGSSSAFSLFLGRGTGLEATDEQENLLSKGENGATGVVKFALRTDSGEPVPPGNYTVDVYGPGSTSGEDGDVVARKFFAVEG